MRTSTVHHLEVTPPADWATCAHGGWCTDRTCAPLRVRRLSMPVPYLSANHPELAEAGRVERPRPFGTHGFRDRPPRPMGFALPWFTAVSGAPRWIRTSNLRSSRARHLYQLGYRGSSGMEMDDARSSARRLNVSNVSAYLVAKGSRIGPWALYVGGGRRCQLRRRLSISARRRLGGISPAASRACIAAAIFGPWPRCRGGARIGCSRGMPSSSGNDRSACPTG